MWQDFKAFLMRGNILDLAIGVIIGGAFALVLNSFVTGMVTPLLGIFGKIPDFAAWTFAINGSVFKIGLFINALISFVLTAAMLYFVIVRPVSEIQAKKAAALAAAPATTKSCTECCSEIALAAKRCPHCTSVQA